MKLKKSQTLNLTYKGPNFSLREKQIEIFGNLTQAIHMASEAPWNMSSFVSLFFSVLALLASFCFYYLLFYFTCVGILPVYMTRITCMPGALKGQRSTLDPLELPCGCWDWKLGPL